MNFMQNDICHTYQLMNISNTPLFEHLQHHLAYVRNKQACVSMLLTTEDGMLAIKRAQERCCSLEVDTYVL